MRVITSHTSDAQAELRLISSWARREFHGTYRQSGLRVVWAVVQPLSVFFVYVIVFHWILKVDSDGLPYLSFMVTGVVLWRYFAIGLNCATSLVDRASVLSRVYFRREIVPLSICLAGLLDLAIGTVALVSLAWVQGLAPSPTLLALPLVYLPLVLYTAGTAVLLATVTVFVRDVGHAMPTVAQLLFLATPIMYSPAQLPPELSFLATVNPIAVLVQQARNVALSGMWPSPVAIGVNTVLSAVFLTATLAYIRSIEHRIVDIA